MDNEPLKDPYNLILNVLFLYSQMFISGTFILLFLTTFLTFEESEFISRYDIYLNWLKYFLILNLVLIFIFILYYFLHYKKNKISNNTTYIKFWNKNNFFHFIIFQLMCIIILISEKFSFQFQIIDLLAFITILLLIFRLAHQYTFQYDRLTWRHPTTYGNIIQGTLAIGMVMGLVLYPGTNFYRIFGWLLLIILSTEFLALWNRLKFLSTASQQSRKVVQMMLGSHLPLFGIRFIFGIIMPIVYISWSLFIRKLPLHPVLLMILVGELCDRILFFITSIPTKETIKSINNIKSIQMNKEK